LRANGRSEELRIEAPLESCHAGHCVAGPFDDLLRGDTATQREPISVILTAEKKKRCFVSGVVLRHTRRQVLQPESACGMT